MFDPLKSLEKHLGEFDFNSRVPFYNDSSDYTTNAPSYYDDLARKNKLIKHLALRIWEYDDELKKRFEAWDKNLEEFDDEVLRLLKEWMEDGTFDEIINEVLFGKLNDRIDHTNDKFPFISIKDFPRKTGEIDDSPRIQRALDTIRDGGTLQFYDDVYITSQPVRLSSNQTLEGMGVDVTTIRNNAGTHVISTIDNDTRYYYINVNEMSIDGSIIGSQTGLHLPQVTHSTFNNLLIRNVSTGIYIIARKADGTVTGAYYSSFYNMFVSKTHIGIHLDSIANENKFYGGKVNLSDTGVLVQANNNGFYGVCFEANFEKNIHITGYNNSFYSPRMEGRNTAIGVHHDLPDHTEKYSNFIYSPHMQNLKQLILDERETLFMISDQGMNVPVRLSQPIIKGTRRRIGSQPMSLMKNISEEGGYSVNYGSEQQQLGAVHYQATTDGEVVAEINGYGDYVSYRPHRGVQLTSPNGSVYRIRISDDGELDIGTINKVETDEV